MRLKKVMCVTLAAAMLMGSLAGCAKKDNKVDNPSVTQPATDENNKGSDDNKENTDAPVANAEPVELKIHFHSNNKYTLLDENGKLLPVFALAGEKTNSIVESTANPVAQNSIEEFQLQASEKFPADIYGGTSLRSSIISYAYQGAFLPLNDLIDQYAPNLKKFLDENPDVKAAHTAADGNIYMLNYCPDGDVARVYFIRTDWLNKLGLSMPTTFEELENVLYAFRNNDPNGNGLKDEVPVFNDKWEELIRLANLWGARVYGFDTFTERVVLDANDKFYQAWTAPEFKEALIGLSKWYKDGIIDQEAFTRKQNTARQTLWAKENTGGMTHEFFASTSAFNYNTEVLAAVPDFKLEAFLPVNKNGAGFEEHQRAIAKQDGWAISASTKNAEAAIRYMDWFYSEEGRRAINFGIEGESYTMVNGVPTFTEDVLKQGNVNTYLQSAYGAQLPIGYKQNYDYEDQWVTKEGRDANELYSSNKASVYTVKTTPVLSFTEEETAEYDQCLTALNEYQNEMVTAFITGKTDIESNWDAYIAKCKELGVDTLVGLYETAYTRYKAIK